MGSELLNTQGPITEPSPHYGSTTIINLFAYEFVPDHILPTLFGYIITVMILTMLPGPYSRSTTFDDELSLRRSSSS